MGIRFGGWLRCLHQNRYKVDSTYMLRAGVISLMSVLNSATCAIDRAIYGKQLRAGKVKAPVFIVGHWRTGTTHLHQLLSQDSQFVVPNLVQTIFPESFLVVEPLVRFAIRPFLPETRLIDNMPFTVETPQEDEFALAVMCRLSPYLAYSFPRNWDAYDRYISIENACASEQKAWADSLQKFISRIVLKSSKTALLKSPLHTARIRSLVAMYPTAKFIHISRHPYEVFQSTRHMLSIGPPMAQLQVFDFKSLDETILRRFHIILSCYLDQRTVIPQGNLHELRFEDLQERPFDHLKEAYDRLGLSGFDDSWPRMERYLESIKDYAKTAHPALDESTRASIAERLSLYFTEFGYQA